jgi:hypothetical protein
LQLRAYSSQPTARFLMGHRQHQHLGRSADDGRELPGRDVEGAERVRSDVVAEAEDAREVSRLIDESEGWKRERAGGRRRKRGSRGKKK